MQRLVSILSCNANNAAQLAADAPEDIRPSAPVLQAQEPGFGDRFPGMPLGVGIRQRERAGAIAADLDRWRCAGHADESRYEAAEIIADCAERRTKSLSLSHLGLTSIPDCVGTLTHLEELALDHNQLSRLPGNLGDFESLERLDISHNKFLEIPPQVFCAAHLQSLKANNNQITQILPSFAPLPALRNLQLHGNRLTNVPIGIHQLGRGATIFIHDNALSPDERQALARRCEGLGYNGPAIFQRRFDERTALAYERDPFSKMSGLEKIEALLASAEKMSDGRYDVPENFRLGGRNMNRKDCLLMALEISLASHRELTPAISYRLLTELPSDIGNFLVNSVSFGRDRIEAWSRNEEVAIALKPAREVINVESSLMERGPEHAYNQDQNVHDARVHGNFVRQFQLIQNQVAGEMTPAEAMPAITSMILATTPASGVSRAHAMEGLRLVMARDDLARGFSKSPADTLAMLWKYVEDRTDGETQANLHGAIRNRLAEIGSGHICGLGMTERIIDIPTAVDWSVTNSISYEHLHTEIAKMASDVNEEFEAKFGDYADFERALATESQNAVTQGDTEQRINEIKRDMFRAKACVELVLLRNLDEGLVSREVDKIFDADMMRERL